MKITGIRTFVVANVPPYHGGRRWVFVKLLTDEGIEGIGEWSTAHLGREKSQIGLIEALAARTEQQFVHRPELALGRLDLQAVADPSDAERGKEDGKARCKH